MSNTNEGLGFQHPQELPPIRDNPALSPLAHTPVRDMDFLCDPLRADLKTPGGRLALRAQNVRTTGGRLSQLDVRTDSAHSSAGDMHEQESLKRQVSRLTQLRRDRDNYIQDLLSEAEATQRRHEGEIARRTVRTQREASDRLSAQQREHDLHLEERSRAHAAALAQQAWQHEREIEELRKSLRIDSERRLSERLTEVSSHYRDLLRRLGYGVDELRHRLASHSAASGHSVLGDGEMLGKGKDGSSKTDAPSACPASSSSSPVLRQNLSSSTGSAAEPEPEEAVSGNLALAPRDPLEEQAIADRSASEAAASLEWSIVLAKKDLESALKNGRRFSNHELPAQDESQFKQKLKEAIARLEAEKRKMCGKAKEYAAAASSASSQTLLLKVLLTWSDEVRRLRSLVAEQQRVGNKRLQRRPLVLARIQADMNQFIHVVFRTWVAISANTRRETVDKEALSVREATLASKRDQLRRNVILMTTSNVQWVQQLVFNAWRSDSRSSSSEAVHKEALTSAVSMAAKELQTLRQELAQETKNMRRKWRLQGIHFINAEVAHIQLAALRAWSSVSQRSQAVKAADAKLVTQQRELGESRKTQGFLVAQAAVEHTRLLAFHAWGGARLMAKCEADALHRLDLAAIEASQSRSEVEVEAQGLRSRLSGERRAQGLRLGRGHSCFQKRIMLLKWAIATREAKREAGHRRQLITAAADSSAEVYRLRGDGKRVAVELRRQRRAHGVAAIHANLDRRLQSVLLAWGAVVRDSQREASYQRQLDISAAESAAGCAVLRMEGRRTNLELREERRTQALRAIDAGVRHWQHVTLREWRVQVDFAHQRAQFEAALAEERRQGFEHVLEVEASHRAELQEQAADCEARISSSLSASAAAGGRAGEPSDASRFNEEREALQAQIAKLHDELRRLHGHT